MGGRGQESRSEFGPCRDSRLQADSGSAKRVGAGSRMGGWGTTHRRQVSQAKPVLRQRRLKPCLPPGGRSSAQVEPSLLIIYGEPLPV